MKAKKAKIFFLSDLLFLNFENRDENNQKSIHYNKNGTFVDTTGLFRHKFTNIMLFQTVKAKSVFYSHLLSLFYITFLILSHCIGLCSPFQQNGHVLLLVGTPLD
jgi:succinate-acetate transporter protein